MDERWEEGSVRVSKAEAEMLDVMSYPSEGLDPTWFGKRVCCKDQVGSYEQTLRDEVAAC